MSLFFKIFKWIFIILSSIMFLVQAIDLFKNGMGRDTLVIVSELLILIWFMIMWRFKQTIYNLFKKIKSVLVRFVLLGIISTGVAETAYIFSKPLHENLFWDLFLTLPWYFLWMLAWYFVLKKYKFTLTEAFILGGLHGFIIEGVMNGIILNPLMALISLPLFTAIYGFFFTVPYLVFEQDFNSQKETSLTKKVLISFLPILAYIPGFLWILSWVKLLELQLFIR